jgi:hypothetical protein
MEHRWEVRVAAPNLASLTTPAVSIVSRALLSFTYVVALLMRPSSYLQDRPLVAQ